MAHRPGSRQQEDEYPEVVPPSLSGFNIYNSSYEYYLPQHSPAPEYIPQRSPAPEYSSYRASPSPRLSANSPPPLSTDFTRSPSSSDAGWKVRTPPVQYSEFQSPDPERVYSPPPPKIEDEKEYYNKAGTIAGIAAAPPLDYKPTIARKPLPQSHVQVEAVAEEPPAPPKKKPIYKRPLGLIIALAILAFIAVAVACGVVFGTKHSKPPQSTEPPTNGTGSPTVEHGDPNLAVGGYLSPSYYSRSGAFNGSGVALAQANPGVDQTIYVFYQDFKGDITYKLMEGDGSFSQVLGTVNDQSSNPLNGTPLSIVNTHSVNNSMVYHLFYIDENYLIIERTLQTNVVSSGSVIPVWVNGPLTSKKLKTMEADTIGMQACLWNNYYGGYTSNRVHATDGIQFWYATSETSFAQYSWTNGTSTWNHDEDWNGYDGHAGVGCQTWDSWMIEYVFLADTNQNMAMFWRDNNQSAPSTPSHPTLKWNKIQNVTIPDVHKSSSLGYTTYMLYQNADASIRGANISWAAENTSIATVESTGALDVFTIDDLDTHDPVEAIRGTHLTITALKTPSGGSELVVFFQQTGDDVSQYTRDMEKAGGLWQKGASLI